MAENDLSTADALISRAEALNVQYNWWYQGDTPKKARRDLDRKREAAGPAPVKPSQAFSPPGPNKDKQAPATDPMAGRLTSPAGAPGAQQVMPLPAVDASKPMPPFSAQDLSAKPLDQIYPTVPTDKDVRAAGIPAGVAMGSVAAGAPAGPSAGDSLLRAARCALAVGDVRHANELVLQEKAKHANYQLTDDTPDKVEAAIRKYQQLSSMDKSTEGYRHAYASTLMDQADGLLRCGEYDEAERLASRAAGMQTSYSPIEQKPQDMLQRIAAMRRQDVGRAAASSNVPGFATASAAGGPHGGRAAKGD